MRSESLINRRNKLIYERYSELWGAGQREELIWPVLKHEFHLEENTIYRIVLHITKEVQSIQPEMFEKGAASATE